MESRIKVCAGRVKFFAQTSFLLAWRIHKTLFQCSFRSQSDENKPFKSIHLGKSSPLYYTHFDSCSKTATHCKKLAGCNFSLRTKNGKGPKMDSCPFCIQLCKLQPLNRFFFFFFGITTVAGQGLPVPLMGFELSVTPFGAWTHDRHVVKPYKLNI